MIEDKNVVSLPSDAPLTTYASADKVEAALRLEVASFLFGQSKTPEGLRDRVRELTAVLREMGLPPESALLRVKAAMFTAGLTGAADSRTVCLSTRDRMTICETLVTWCIESYFDPSTDSQSDSFLVQPGLKH